MRDDKTVLWALVNIAGLAIMIIGMFGVVELLDFEYAIYVFVAGTVVTLASMSVILRSAYRTDGNGGGR